MTDRESTRTTEQRRSQTVDIESRTILLGIALHASGAENVSVDRLRNVETNEAQATIHSHSGALDRDTVFSALALGLSTGSDHLGTLACISDRLSISASEASSSRRIDLGTESVLSAIALSGSTGETFDVDDVASFDERAFGDATETHFVELDREDVFLALALGAGGE